MKTPIDLQLDNLSVAQITSFGYETPWATGDVIFKDDILFETLIKITSITAFDLELERLGLSDAEEEKRWETKLVELGLSYEELDLDNAGRWSIVPKGGSAQIIYSPKFYPGYMDWRL